MSKRFIDTEMFEDSWFMDLSKDMKLTYIYLITKCNHAGLIEINTRLFEFQTGIKWTDKTVDILSNRLLRVSEGLYFLPKFLEFQYPGWPNSKVKAQKSAIDMLSKHPNLSKYLTVSKPFTKGYGYGYDNGNVSDNGKKTKVELTKDFYDAELLIAEENKDKESYSELVNFLYGKNSDGIPLDQVLKLDKQLTYKQFKSLTYEFKNSGYRLSEVLEQMNNRKTLLKDYTTVSGTARGWLKYMQQTKK